MSRLRHKQTKNEKKCTGYVYKHIIMQHKEKWDITKYVILYMSFNSL